MGIEKIDAIADKILQVLVEEKLTIAQAENVLLYAKAQLASSKVSF